MKSSSDVAELLFWLMQSSSENDTRARGKKGGRRRVLTEKQISIGKSLAADKSRSVSDICETLKISPATYYRYIH